MACPTARRVGISGETTVSSCPLPRSKTGLRQGEKKAQSRMDTEFLDWALADFSGYVAADELYDGPFCILSAVDNRCYKRILYDVLAHDPRRGLSWGAASTVPVSCRQGYRQSGVGRGIQRPQSPGSHTAQIGQRAPEHTSSQAGRPHEKAAGSARCRVVQASAPVRPASPEQNRTEDPMARQPWITPVTGAACAHGAGLHVVRPTVSDPDSPRQAGQAEASPATVQAAR